ncbi:hypothetical protein SAMN05660236_0403 [Ohtaekwangia koreensis]|uniref:Uncharacterized protein n=1 Tax=Ohtaekwangia koreensis TaxID=688867 RepID=A0A1T5IU25_9BACT|nr:hypothetical protein SAMN05660236_0403 [Ohtaekwangia koreensis]
MESGCGLLVKNTNKGMGFYYLILLKKTGVLLVVVAELSFIYTL